MGPCVRHTKNTRNIAALLILELYLYITLSTWRVIRTPWSNAIYIIVRRNRTNYVAFKFVYGFSPDFCSVKKYVPTYIYFDMREIREGECSYCHGKDLCVSPPIQFIDFIWHFSLYGRSLNLYTHFAFAHHPLKVFYLPPVRFIFFSSCHFTFCTPYIKYTYVPRIQTDTLTHTYTYYSAACGARNLVRLLANCRHRSSFVEDWLCTSVQAIAVAVWRRCGLSGGSRSKGYFCFSRINLSLYTYCVYRTGIGCYCNNTASCRIRLHNIRHTSMITL
jgi:hypothetical protein